MEDKDNFLNTIQLLMDNVKKDALIKIENNKDDIIQNKDIINSLFNLLDYQKTLINQIYLFNEKIKNNDIANAENLVNINKDILVSMICKFLINLNTMFNKAKNNGNIKYNIMNKNQNFFKRGKIINLLYSTNNNSNILLSNSFTQYGSPIKKNMEKEFNSAISLTQQSSAKKILSFIDPDKNSYKFLRNKNLMFSIKHKPNNDVYDKLYYNKDQRCNHEEKRRNKIMQYQAYSKSMKDIFVDLNDDNSKKIFNKSIRTNTSKGKKRIRDNDL